MNDINDRIMAVKKELGPNLLILGHHYQRSSVLKYADGLGDSLELARMAGTNTKAEKIVFCGVKFMAESADILTGSGQTVYMPDLFAGCPMANMATVEAMEKASAELEALGPGWLPVVYVNSTAAIKACCGRMGGSTCTSSNAANVFKWVFDQGKKVFFLPDEHLGWNTGTDMGIPDSEIVVYDPAILNGGLSIDDITHARIVVWKGYCIVHQAFKCEHVEHVRKNMPGAKIIVHPETPKEVVRLCDEHGSTSQIIRYVENAADGETIVIGTEVNLVDRLAQQFKDRLIIKSLSPSVCANMARINEANLMELLQSFNPDNEIHVPETIAEDARRALSTMLGI